MNRFKMAHRLLLLLCILYTVNHNVLLGGGGEEEFALEEQQKQQEQQAEEAQQEIIKQEQQQLQEAIEQHNEQLEQEVLEKLNADQAKLNLLEKGQGGSGTTSGTSMPGEPETSVTSGQILSPEIVASITTDAIMSGTIKPEDILETLKNSLITKSLPSATVELIATTSQKALENLGKKPGANLRDLNSIAQVELVSQAMSMGSRWEAVVQSKSLPVIVKENITIDEFSAMSETPEELAEKLRMSLDEITWFATAYKGPERPFVLVDKDLANYFGEVKGISAEFNELSLLPAQKENLKSLVASIKAADNVTDFLKNMYTVFGKDMFTSTLSLEDYINSPDWNDMLLQLQLNGYEKLSGFMRQVTMLRNYIARACVDNLITSDPQGIGANLQNIIEPVVNGDDFVKSITDVVNVGNILATASSLKESISASVAQIRSKVQPSEFVTSSMLASTTAAKLLSSPDLTSLRQVLASVYAYPDLDQATLMTVRDAAIAALNDPAGLPRFNKADQIQGELTLAQIEGVAAVRGVLVQTTPETLSSLRGQMNDIEQQITNMTKAGDPLSQKGFDDALLTAHQLVRQYEQLTFSLKILNDPTIVEQPTLAFKPLLDSFSKLDSQEINQLPTDVQKIQSYNPRDLPGQLYKIFGLSADADANTIYSTVSQQIVDLQESDPLGAFKKQAGEFLISDVGRALITIHTLSPDDVTFNENAGWLTQSPRVALSVVSAQADAIAREDNAVAYGDLVESIASYQDRATFLDDLNREVTSLQQHKQTSGRSFVQFFTDFGNWFKEFFASTKLEKLQAQINSVLSNVVGQSYTNVNRADFDKNTDKIIQILESSLKSKSLTPAEQSMVQSTLKQLKTLEPFIDLTKLA